MEQWQTGDIITAERLNGMMGVVLHETFDQADDGLSRLDKTAQEIIDIVSHGLPFSLYKADDNSGNYGYDFCTSLYWYGNDAEETFNFQIDFRRDAYLAHSLDEYPLRYAD